MDSLETLCEAYGQAENREDEGLILQSAVAKRIYDTYGRQGLKELSTRYRRSMSTLFLRVRVGSLLGLRQPMLTYGHLAVVAYEPNPQEWLAKAVEQEWSLRELRREIAVAKSLPKATDEIIRDLRRWVSRGKDLWDDLGGVGLKNEFLGALDTVKGYVGMNSQTKDLTIRKDVV